MPPLISDDPDRIGHALLRPDPPRDGPLSVSIRFLDGTYLGEGGRRSPARHLFPAEPHGRAGTYALGPAITAHMREAEVVALADADGDPLGTAAWDSVRPPPDPGRGALLGSAGRPMTPAPSTTGPEPAPPEPVAAPPTAPERDPPDERTEFAPPVRRRRSGWVLASIVPILLALALWPALVLSGRLGWTVEPAALALSPDGTRDDTARLVALWPARPFAALLPAPFALAAAPDGMALVQARDGDGWALQAMLLPGRFLPGHRVARVPAVFPLGGASAGLGVDIALTVPEPPPTPVPPFPAPQPRPASPPVPPSPVDDAACDRAAGNRLDPDHPAGAGAVDDVFALAPEALDAGIATCDPAPGRGGAARRLVVQRGRLLAARAVARADRGDAAGARADMDEALRHWRVGSNEGSGFADSLLGSYLFGAFDRPALSFVAPDDAAAVDAWRRGMGRGSLASQRNYAAQLLGGHGLAADPPRALSLLRDGIARGDEAAAGVLGVALYTGFPAGVARDSAEGWRLMVRAQCLDRPSAALVGAETARGARPSADRRSCP